MILFSYLFNWSLPYYIRKKVSKKILKFNDLSHLEIDRAKSLNSLDFKIYTELKGPFDSFIQYNRNFFEDNLNNLNLANKIYDNCFSLGRKVKRKIVNNENFTFM